MQPEKLRLDASQRLTEGCAAGSRPRLPMCGAGVVLDPRIYDESQQAHAGPTSLEYRAQQVVDYFPECEITRTTASIQIRFDSLEGIVVLVSPEAFEIRLPTIEWTHGTHGPAAVTRLWRRLEVAEMKEYALRAAIEEAVEVRRSEFSPCRFCGERVAIEHRHDNVCHGCAERRLGVVH